MTNTKLKAWLRNNCSGIYRPARDAADLIDLLEENIQNLLNATEGRIVETKLEAARKKAREAIQN